MDDESFARWMKQGGVAVFFLGLIGYAVLVIMFLCNIEYVVKLLGDKKQYTFGLPVCGISAFAIVTLLERLSPAKSDSSGKIEFKAFGLTFTGPAGPVTLWAVCYLVLVWSARLVQ